LTSKKLSKFGLQLLAFAASVLNHDDDDHDDDKVMIMSSHYLLTK